MSAPLILFPNRVAIGSAGGVPVYMSPEFSRALSALLTRVGGETSVGMSDLAAELELLASSATAPQPAPMEAQELQTAAVPAPRAEVQELQTGAVSALHAEVQELRHQVAALTGQLAALGELGKSVGDLAAQGVGVTPPTDWEHPGKIGARTANSAAFTTVTATGEVRGTQPAGGAFYGMWNQATNANSRNWALASNYNVYGDCHLLISNALGGDPAAAGTSVWQATGAGFTVAKAFGCNGKAAQTAAALGVAATDAASTQTLANNIRAALIANGIGN